MNGWHRPAATRSQRSRSAEPGGNQLPRRITWDHQGDLDAVAVARISKAAVTARAPGLWVIGSWCVSHMSPLLSTRAERRWTNRSKAVKAVISNVGAYQQLGLGMAAATRDTIRARGRTIWCFRDCPHRAGDGPASDPDRIPPGHRLVTGVRAEVSGDDGPTRAARQGRWSPDKIPFMARAQRAMWIGRACGADSRVLPGLCPVYRPRDIRTSGPKYALHPRVKMKGQADDWCLRRGRPPGGVEEG